MSRKLNNHPPQNFKDMFQYGIRYDLMSPLHHSTLYTEYVLILCYDQKILFECSDYEGIINCLVHVKQSHLMNIHTFRLKCTHSYRIQLVHWFLKDFVFDEQTKRCSDTGFLESNNMLE